jgi:hypothetical protein
VIRTPFVVAGLVLAALFGWQSCIALQREPTHPAAQPSDEDYPLIPGLTWVYKSASGFQVIRKLAPEVEEAGHRWFEMNFTLPIGREKLLMRRTPEGIVARRADREQLIMRFPMRPGDAWTIDFPDRPLAECTVLDPEEIDALSQRRLASKLRVIKTDRKSGKKTTNYEWYVRGVGLARMEVVYGFKATFELERFEKAK